MRVRPHGLLLATGAVALVLAAALAWMCQPLLIEPAPADVPEVNTAALRRHVVMLSRLLAPRGAAHHANLSAAGSYVAQELARSGARVGIQTWESGGRSYSNFSVRFGPPQGARVVVGAHYDAAGESPGADDNASGVAALAELARLLAANPPPRPVELVAYALEHAAHLPAPDSGSARHADALDRAGTPVALVIALEGLGYFSEAPGSQGHAASWLDWLYADRGDFIAIVGRVGEGGAARDLKAGMRAGTRLPVRSLNAPAALTGMASTGLEAYRAHGAPALLVTDTGKWRNPAHGSAGDVADTLDYVRMTEVVRGVFNYLARAG